MSKSRNTCVAFAALSICAMVALFLPATLSVRAETEARRVAPMVRIAPPAPVFNEKERLAELARRRAHVAEAIGPKSLLILFSTEPRVYTNDVDYQYRQENNLYYLTNLKQKGATLVLLPGNNQVSEILFLPKRNPAAETWTGHMYSPEEASGISGIKEIWETTEFEPFIQSVRLHQPYRPKPEKVLASSSGPSQQGGTQISFDPLFTAAGKNEAE